jgi:hypothetical protein
VGVKAVVIYESLTGNTRKAAGLVAGALESAGWAATVCNVTHVDMQSLAAADLVVVGSWTDGFIFVGQRPGRAGRLKSLPVMYGKKCVVYCTYAIDPGQTLEKLSAILRDRGADVLGGYAIRRDRMTRDVREFVNRTLDVVAPA